MVILGRLLRSLLRGLWVIVIGLSLLGVVATTTGCAGAITAAEAKVLSVETRMDQYQGPSGRCPRHSAQDEGTTAADNCGLIRNNERLAENLHQFDNAGRLTNRGEKQCFGQKKQKT